jgi:hypothetical protein
MPCAGLWYAKAQARRPKRAAYTATDDARRAAATILLASAAAKMLGAAAQPTAKPPGHPWRRRGPLAARSFCSLFGRTPRPGQQGGAGRKDTTYRDSAFRMQ